MKIDRQKLILIAIDSKCTICGMAIGYKQWECSEKNEKLFFVHYGCIKNLKKEGK